MTLSSLQNTTASARNSFVVTALFAAIAAVIYLFAIFSAEEDLAKTEKTRKQLQNDLRGKKHRLENAAGIKQRLEEQTAALAPFRSALLDPGELDSYAESARKTLLPLALGAGLSDIYCSVEGVRALPVPPGGLPRQLYARQGIRIKAVGSYQEAVSFLLRVERDLPLVSLQSMDIEVKNDSKTEQAVTFVLEWPIKGKVTRP